MAKLEGIIYKTFDHYVVLRGFAPIKDLAAISHKPNSYQRNALDNHKKEIVEFLANGEYKYFPEITLACRVNDYEKFVSNIGVDNAIDRDDAQFVSGLKVLSERLPYDGYRARHAYLIKRTNDDLVRVDGNHRLEPFDNPNDSVWTKTNANINELNTLIVPFTVIFSAKEEADKFEAGIFHNINFKQEPLRQEASLKIIHDLNVFVDNEKLGAEYPIVFRLIDKIKSGRYNAIPWLRVNDSTDKDYYRTSCLRIVQLINKFIPKIKEAYEDGEKRLPDTQAKHDELYSKLAELQKSRNDLIDKLNDFKFKSDYDVTAPEYKALEKDVYKNSLLVRDCKNQYNEAKHSFEVKNSQVQAYESFLCKTKDVNAIEQALNIVAREYEQFEENEYGNIAFLCTMVYYALLDKNQLKSFVYWAKQNGINKIVDSDDMSDDGSENLVNMFDRIHQSKKNEIFISMQFGDSQSELIYEKIVRAIEKFNAKHKNITLNAQPIRIDKTIESSTYSIQDRILKAIQDCSLIIADLSSANINVYHEIGYAMGVAESHNMLPNMILLYKEDTDFNKERKTDTDKFIGFNLRNLSQLRFKNYEQLVDGLVERLEKHYGV
jgi:hypothetical protein